MQLTTHTGTASDLREGDFVDEMGGPKHRRYTVGASVASVRPAGGKVRLVFTRKGSYTCLANYPVTYRRAAAN